MTELQTLVRNWQDARKELVRLTEEKGKSSAFVWSGLAGKYAAAEIALMAYKEEPSEAHVQDS